MVLNNLLVPVSAATVGNLANLKPVVPLAACQVNQNPSLAPVEVATLDQIDLDLDPDLRSQQSDPGDFDNSEHVKLLN